MNNENDLIHCELITDGSNLLNIQVLLDSGSRSTDRDNYVSSKVAAWIRDTKVNVNNTCSLAPEVALSKSTILLGGIDSSRVVSCNFKFLNELTNSYEIIKCLEFHVLDGEYDCIIGLNTIRKYKLSFFDGQEGVANPTCVSALYPLDTTNVTCSCAHPVSRPLGDCRGSGEKGEDILQPWYVTGLGATSGKKISSTFIRSN